MPYRKTDFINSEIYHVILRGIDNKLVFNDIDDYYRGIFSIYEFNNANPVSIKDRRKIIKKFKNLSRGRASGQVDPMMDNRNKFVDIFSFCFMPNHIHLLLLQNKDNGITKFMSKVGTGYAGYFNRKYKRKGYLFQNRFLSVHIKDEGQLKTVFTYIHANPISLSEPGWKEKGIGNPEKIIFFLANYKWSSYPDYLGTKNFPSVTNREFMIKVMEGSEMCEEFIKNWVMHKKETKELMDVFLD